MDVCGSCVYTSYILPGKLMHVMVLLNRTEYAIISSICSAAAEDAPPPMALVSVLDGLACVFGSHYVLH